MLRSFARGISDVAIHGKIEGIIKNVISERADGLLAEHEVLDIVSDLGLSVAPHLYVTKEDDPLDVIRKIHTDKLVAKGVVRRREDNLLVTHKTDIGALQFNVPRTEDGVAQAMRIFEEKFNENSPYKLEGTLFVEQMKMSGDFGTELIVSEYQDPFFGPTVCYGFGGTIVFDFSGAGLSFEHFSPAPWQGSSFFARSFSNHSLKASLPRVCFFPGPTEEDKYVKKTKIGIIIVI